MYGVFQPTVTKLRIGLKNQCEKSFYWNKFEEAVVKISAKSEHFNFPVTVPAGKG